MFPYSLYIGWFNCTFQNTKPEYWNSLDKEGKRPAPLCLLIFLTRCNTSIFEVTSFSMDLLVMGEASGTLACLLGSNLSCLLRNFLELHMFSKKKKKS